MNLISHAHRSRSERATHNYFAARNVLVDERGPSLVGFLQNLSEGLAQPQRNSHRKWILLIAYLRPVTSSLNADQVVDTAEHIRSEVPHWPPQAGKINTTIMNAPNIATGNVGSV